MKIFTRLIMLGLIIGLLSSTTYAQLDLSPPATVSAAAGETVTIPLNLTNPNAVIIQAFGLRFLYPTDLLEFLNTDEAGTLTEGFVQSSGQEPTPGEIVIGGFDFTGTSGSGVLINVVFVVKANAAGSGPLQFTNFSDGLAGATTTDGLFQIAEENQPPIADAGGPYSGIVGATISFDGSGSSDPDGDLLSFNWDFGDGSGGTGVNPAHTYSTSGEFTVTLTVDDGKSGTASDGTQANISPVENQLDLGPPGEVSAAVGETVTIPLNLTNPNGDPVDAFGFKFIFPAELLIFSQCDNVGTLTDGWIVVDCSETGNGELTIGGFNTTATTGSGVLLNAIFQVKTSASGSGDLQLREFADDLTGASTTDGVFQVAAPSNDTLSVVDASGGSGQEDVPVLIDLANNSFPVGGFSFELLYDTQHLSFSTAEIADPTLVIKRASRTMGFEGLSGTIDPNSGPGTLGTITVIGLAEANAVAPVEPPLPFGSGAIVEVLFDVTTDMAVTTGLDLTMGTISNEDGTQQLTPALEDGEFTVIPCLRGDANEDGILGIADVVFIINCLLGIGPCPPLACGDANGDGSLGIADVVYLINCLLGIGPCSSTSLMETNFDHIPIEAQAEVFFGTGGLEKRQSGYLPITANLPAEAAGVFMRFQYDPKRVKIGAPNLSQASAKMDLKIDDSGNKIAVVIYSFAGERIAAGVGELVRIPFETTGGDLTQQSFSLTEVEISDAQGRLMPVVNQWSVSGLANLPEEYELHQNFPNPFNAGTIIKYGIPFGQTDKTQVTIGIYNLRGQLIRILVDKMQPPGQYEVSWDGLDANTKSAPSGIYFYTLKIADHIFQKRMVLLK